MMTAVLSIGFISCGSDDNDKSSGGSTSDPNVVEGTWKGVIDEGNMELIFKGNGQGEWIRREQHSSGPKEIRGVFTYTKESNTRGKANVTIEEKKETLTRTFYYELKEGYLYLYEGGYGQGAAYVLSKEGSSGGGGFNPSASLYGVWTGFIDGANMDITINKDNSGLWVRYEQTKILTGEFTLVKESETKGYAVIQQGDNDNTVYFELRNGKLYFSMSGYGQDETELKRK